MEKGYRLRFESAWVMAGVVADDHYMPEVVRPVQTHSCNVAVVEAGAALPCLDNTDAIVSLGGGIKIGVRTADCVPLVVHAPDIGAVAAIHAGWRGSIGGVAGKTVAILRDLGADLSLAEAAFGPSICGECYEVGPGLAQQFREAGYAGCILKERNVDLEAVNRRQLVAAGMLPGRIHPKQQCTFETPWLPSWRRSATDRRLLTWISLL